MDGREWALQEGWSFGLAFSGCWGPTHTGHMKVVVQILVDTRHTVMGSQQFFPFRQDG